MNNRLETFCDGVFAIALTLLILEIKVPKLESVHSSSDLWHALIQLWPSLFALCLSFVIIFIAWIGHHNLLHLVNKSSPQFLGANGFFLFTVMFIPFPTAFMAEYLNTPYAQPAIIVYCLNGILHNVGWIILYRYILNPQSLAIDDAATQKIRNDSKSGIYGFFAYVAIAVLACWLPYVALVISVSMWLYWLYFSIKTVKEQA